MRSSCMLCGALKGTCQAVSPHKQVNRAGSFALVSGADSGLDRIAMALQSLAQTFPRAGH